MTGRTSNAPFNRVGRLVDTFSSPSDSSLVGKVLVNATPADSLALALKQGKVDIKKALQDIGKLSPEDLAKHPELVKLKEMDTQIKNLAMETRQIGELAREELKPITDDIKNGKYTAEEINYIMDNAPKEATPELVNANRELRGLEPLVEEKPQPKNKEVKLKAKSEKKVKMSDPIKQRFRDTINEDVAPNSNAKTPQVEWKTVDPELASLQKLQESLP